MDGVVVQTSFRVQLRLKLNNDKKNKFPRQIIGFPRISVDVVTKIPDPWKERGRSLAEKNNILIKSYFVIFFRMKFLCLALILLTNHSRGKT